jgi:anti-anti-sigma regulatory factor
MTTLRIDGISGKHGIRIQLSGELRSEHLDAVRAEIEHGNPRVTLDLDEVNLVDIDAVRFLNSCEAQGVEVVNCLPYIREWMFQERAREKNSKKS